MKKRYNEWWHTTEVIIQEKVKEEIQEDLWEHLEGLIYDQADSRLSRDVDWQVRQPTKYHFFEINYFYLGSQCEGKEL